MLYFMLHFVLIKFWIRQVHSLVCSSMVVACSRDGCVFGKDAQPCKVEGCRQFCSLCQDTADLAALGGHQFSALARTVKTLRNKDARRLWP